jgi:hypothetical protein
MTQRLVQMRCRTSTRIGNFTGDPANDVCGVVAVALVLTATGEDPWIRAFPFCGDHAPEEIHEIVSSSADTEYLVMQMPAFGIGELT